VSAHHKDKDSDYDYKHGLGAHESATLDRASLSLILFGAISVGIAKA
jgi:hypothetical protein